jgi:hypothetical protein
MFSGVYLLCETVFVVANVIRKRIESRAGCRFLLLSYAITGLGVIFWFHGYKKPEWSQPMVSLFSLKFWDYFLNVLSLGFGFTADEIVPGVVCLLVTLVPVVVLLVKRDTRWEPSTWRVIAAIMGILAVLTVISMGRTDLTPAKTSRYAEFGFLLIPYVALAWWLALQHGMIRYAVIASFWAACALSYYDTWFFQLYPDVKQENLATLDCVERYYHGVGDGACQNDDPNHKEERIQQVRRALQMKIHFTRQFAATPQSGRVDVP